MIAQIQKGTMSACSAAVVLGWSRYGGSTTDIAAAFCRHSRIRSAPSTPSNSHSRASFHSTAIIHSSAALPSVIVVGGGHAGSEAAYASASLGASTMLVTPKRTDLGAMSCNPSMGGIGKGTLIREIDALGGLMGKMADACAIHFRLLNTSKGAAVHGPRKQIDRSLYRQAMQQQLLADTPGLTVEYSCVTDLLLDESNGRVRVCGVRLGDGRELRCGSVVLTTGTFLRGKLLMGRKVTHGGRRSETNSATQSTNGSEAEPPATQLALTLQRIGLPLARMRTGTPPRLHAPSIDFDRLQEQPSQPPQPFSFDHDASTPFINPNPLRSCFVTHTTAETREHVLGSISSGSCPTYESRPTLSRGAAHSAQQDDSNAPRYCPSIENKYTRFTSRTQHRIILEPEGLNSDIIYPQGLEISSSEEWQQKIVHSLPGLERARMLAYGYAVEYDHLDPTDMHEWMESKRIEGLFLAGQINGTTGYEEAAAQGVIAGINAARHASSSPSSHASTPLILPRSSSLIGVLISDLTRCGVVEPYRMFTSRAEYRITIRQDNADRRLTPWAHKVGRFDKDHIRMRRLEEKERRIAEGMNALRSFRLPRLVWNHLMSMKRGECDLHALASQYSSFDGHTSSSPSSMSAANFLESIPSLTLSDLCIIFPSLSERIHPSIHADLSIDVHYAPFIERQQREIASLESEQSMKLLPISAYSPSLFSHEDYDKLITYQPTTLHQAQQLAISPNACMRLIQITRQAVANGRAGLSTSGNDRNSRKSSRSADVHGDIDEPTSTLHQQLRQQSVS